jgi:hypothetical protein
MDKNKVTRVQNVQIAKHGYLTSDNNQSKFFDNYNIEKFDRANMTSTASSDNITLRSGFNKADYYAERPQDLIPSKFKDVVATCRQSYIKVGIVRNVIDLMTDFAAEDLQIVHPDKKVETFFKIWMNKIKLKDAVDEFIRHFLVDGNVVVKRVTAQLTKPVQKTWLENESFAEPDIKLYKSDEIAFDKNEIPWKYIFLNILALEWKGGEEAQMKGGKQLVFRPSKNLLSNIQKSKSLFQNLGNTTMMLPGKEVPLDMSKMYVAHSKKDSWEDWSPPFLYTVLSDLLFKGKLRQAEIAAMDGWINVIRLWKLGDHTQKIFPTEAAVEKLIGILENNTGGGSVDIVWDSMIEMQEFYPPLEKILGPEKYTQVNRDILIGLGVPEVLIGGQGSNFSNSFIQLKTLVERLKSIRSAVIAWLNNEVILMCKSLEISSLPIVRFKHINLEDENVTRKLVIGLIDRGIVSVETVLDVYGEDFLIEEERMKREKKLGIKVKSPLDKPPKAPGANGRPPASKDSTKRDQRTAKPRRSSAELITFALDAIDSIDENVIPVYMESLNVSNARKLTNEQKDEINKIRLNVLSCIKPSDNTEDIFSIAEAANNPNMEIFRLVDRNINQFFENYGNMPTLTQRKRIEAISWCQYYEDNEVKS